MDKFDKQTRSDIMKKVRSKNTTPEVYVRKLLHRMGYRFRLHVSTLPGTPDIVLPKYKRVILVNGCFWHGCPYCKHARIRPQTNEDYWYKKLKRNKERDRENIELLQELGWRVLVVWECETKKKNAEILAKKLRNFLQLEVEDKR